MSNSLIAVPLNTVTRLKNVTCAYCGVRFSPATPSTKEHVITRNFVPEGTLKANDWNLILLACRTCNQEKADLEDEISAITLQVPNLLRLVCYDTRDNNSRPA